MTDNPSNTERIVMQRVYLIRALRLAISSSVFSMLVTLLALWGIGREVWVAHVLQNAPVNMTDLPRFYLLAFDRTRFIVQALIVLAILAFAILVREVARAIAFFSAHEAA
ncbi:MAG: hypothetical protein WAN50_03435 [Minisyncoccia bacterium]